MAAALVLATVLSLVWLTRAEAEVPAPILHNDNAYGSFGDWYTGAVPPRASPEKPVLLFVQGLHSDYGRWLGSDGYYEAAYNAGYRTAFVQLKDSAGAGGNMWTNGPVLADVIRKTASYYGVPKINIIAHSKGGIDSQTALVYYGASPYVNVVHQLSTPNKGSELADIAYSNWASWLAAILGLKDDAVYSLQTSYMANFRAQTDSRSENNATITYMSAGTGDDGWFTGSWFAHAFLPGADDGAVTVGSAMGLPYGIDSFTKNISHTAMARASQTWSLVQPKLSADSTRSSVSALAAPTNESASAQEDGDMILRGGVVEGSGSVSIPLESGIGRVSLEVMTAIDDTNVKLISPSGRVYRPKVSHASDSEPVFSRAARHLFQLNKPESGDWSIQLSGKKDAYFALARIEGPNKTSLNAGKKVYRKGEAARISVDFGGSIVKGSAKRPSLNKSAAGNAAAQSKALPETAIAEDGRLQLPFQAPAEPGVYNLSFDVVGINGKGEKVTRSVNYNFAVTDEQGNIEN
ncbi:triacylglycerol lipase [Paenibacillus sp. sptzw28]|uniref:esterase/lipase family protein n=1 Tax=Paenibacillus sp. sptzw28 TaxID=715179 RepID=UPI0021611FF9|nr:alpha/beta hydrolase [Paenibacillus sp. sptzw28]